MEPSATRMATEPSVPPMPAISVLMMSPMGMPVANATRKLTSIIATKAWTLPADDEQQEQANAAGADAEKREGGHERGMSGMGRGRAQMEAAENGLVRETGHTRFDVFIWLSYKL